MRREVELTLFQAKVTRDTRTLSQMQRRSAAVRKRNNARRADAANRERERHVRAAEEMQRQANEHICPID